MSAFTTLSNIKNSAGQTRGAYGQVKRRWLHGSLKRQAILMPAMSPLMTEGTITRWKKKEGEAFAAGEVLLQIQNDLYMVDVEAQCPGILGKILMPDGTSNVPVEQVIALVAKDMSELAVLQNRSANSMPIPPPFNSLPFTPSSSAPSSASTSSLPSPRTFEQFKPLSSPRTPTMSPRTPSLFEKHTMGYGYRSAHIGGPRGRVPTPLDSPRFDVELPPCPSPRMPIQQFAESPALPTTPATAKWPQSAVDHESGQVDGAAVRRMIVSNLSSRQLNKSREFEELL